MPTGPAQLDGPPNDVAFDELFRRIAPGTVLREIWRTIFAEEYPEQASPFSFVKRTL